MPDEITDPVILDRLRAADAQVARYRARFEKAEQEADRLRVMTGSVWIIRTSCTEKECPCGDPRRLQVHRTPGAAVFSVHLDIEGGWFRSVYEAVGYWTSDIDGSVPFTCQDLTCMHAPSVHAGDVPFEEASACGYRGILLGSGDDRRLVVFSRLTWSEAG